LSIGGEIFSSSTAPWNRTWFSGEKKSRLIDSVIRRAASSGPTGRMLLRAAEFVV
jgi:hypothetical protein